MSERSWERGERVHVVGGPAAAIGLTGTVFRLGEERVRVGVRSDEGEIWWVEPRHLAPSDSPAPWSSSLCPPEKGDVVRWRDADGARFGTVFWVGTSRGEDGARLGVIDTDGESWWLNAAWVEVVADGSIHEAAVRVAS